MRNLRVASVVRRLLCCAALGAAVLSGGAVPVRADGWKIQVQGAKALGLGYAGRALAEDASTIWFNPAGMMRLFAGGADCAAASARAACRPWVMTAGGAIVPFGLHYTDTASFSVLGQSLSGGAATNGGRTGAVPFLYVARRLAARMAAGLGLNVPHGLSDDYGETWVGRYHATRSELQVLNINPVIAIAAHPAVAVSVGLDIQRASVTLENMLDFGSYGAALGAPLTPQSVDGRISLKADDWAVGYDLSVNWQITPALRAASTYRSQITHMLEGDADFDVPPAAAAFTLAGAFLDADVATAIPMPHELSAALAFEASRRWTLVGDLTWTGWSRFERLSVSFANPAQAPLTQRADYEDSLRGAAGVVFRPDGIWTLRAGALYEASPVPDATRTPRLPEVDNVGISAGVSWRFNEAWDLDFGWSHLIPHNAPIRVHDPAAGTLAGRVRWTTDALAVGINRRF